MIRLQDPNESVYHLHWIRRTVAALSTGRSGSDLDRLPGSPVECGSGVIGQSYPDDAKDNEEETWEDDGRFHNFGACLRPSRRNRAYRSPGHLFSCVSHGTFLHSFKFCATASALMRSTAG